VSAAIRTIKLVNATKREDVDEALTFIAATIETELHRVARAWGEYVWGITDDIGRQGWTMRVVENDPSTPSGALGWHDVDAHGNPTATIDLGVIEHYGGTLYRGSLSLSAVISHEVFEMIGDPACSTFEMDGAGTCWARELCDAVEADTIEYSYCDLSNWLLPAYFNAFAPGPYDRAELVTKPFEIRPGGYAIKYDGTASEVFADDAARAHPKMGRRAFRSR
jgi:hypothetical protein